MKKHLELAVRGGRKTYSPSLKKQCLIAGFAVAVPHYSHLPLRQLPLQSPLKQPVKRPVGRPSKCEKTSSDSDHKGAVSSEYQQWVDQEKNHDEAGFLTFCGTRATGSSTGIPKKHRGTYAAKKLMEVREYIAATGVSVRHASVEFNIPKSTIQNIESSTAMPPNRKVHKKGAGRPLSYNCRLDFRNERFAPLCLYSRSKAESEGNNQ